jgi:hypothetical protein
MGAAEMGREVGDAGAPAFVGVVAAGLGLQTGLALFAAVVLVAGLLALGAAPHGRESADRRAGGGSEAA